MEYEVMYLCNSLGIAILLSIAAFTLIGVEKEKNREIFETWFFIRYYLHFKPCLTSFCVPSTICRFWIHHTLWFSPVVSGLSWARCRSACYTWHTQIRADQHALTSFVSWDTFWARLAGFGRPYRKCDLSP